MTTLKIIGLSTFVFIATSFQVVTSLQLVNVSVPRYAELRSDVSLSCHFELSGASLYSVKWYKDDHEFYRYMPGYMPTSQVFPQPGIDLNELLSGINVVRLRRLSFNSSGSYRCEVSTEGPNFETVFSTENMTVRALPAGDPVITGLQLVYSPGDIITANCSAPRSKPAANLAWYLNGMRVDRFSLVYYAANIDEEGLSKMTLGLNAHTEVALFPGGGALELRCTATVQERTWATVKSANLARLSNQKLAQDHEPNQATGLQCMSGVLYLIFTFLVCWRTHLTTWSS